MITVNQTAKTLDEGIKKLDEQCKIRLRKMVF